mmetsp:Transcript_10068/g.22624  ORF Transcript_10068/g.22624 Transcript_10068/m.22624 type:complete len:111 (+) Transcript_10068:178-510(+)
MTGTATGGRGPGPPGGKGITPTGQATPSSTSGIPFLFQSGPVTKDTEPGGSPQAPGGIWSGGPGGRGLMVPGGGKGTAGGAMQLFGGKGACGVTEVKLGAVGAAGNVDVE